MRLPAETHFLITTPENGGIPNNPRMPALVLPRIVSADMSSESVQGILEGNGWGGSWIWTVYDFHHFHPASHEVLVCVSGRASLQIGGPDGREVEVSRGDAVVLPAGFGHRRIWSDDDFAVVGAYPAGQEKPEIIRQGDMPIETARARIAATPLPDRDPLSGRDGLLMRVWGA